ERVVVVVMDEPESSELVHEEADARPRGSDHLREYLLTDLWKNGLRRVVFAEMCQQEEHTSQSFLAGVEEMVDQVLFNATVALEEVRHEPSGEGWLRLQHSEHLLSCDAQDLTLRQRCRGGQSA